jgi:hypothetical protein
MNGKIDEINNTYHGVEIDKIAVRRYSFGHEGIYAGDHQTDAIASRPQGEIEPVFFWKLEQDFVYLNNPIIPEFDREMLIKRIKIVIEREQHKAKGSHTTVIWGSKYGITLYEFHFNLELFWKLVSRPRLENEIGDNE